MHLHIIGPSNPGWVGGGGSLPLEAVPDAREKRKRVKRVSNTQGWARNQYLMREKKKRVKKGISKSGVGTEREKWEKRVSKSL